MSCHTNGADDAGAPVLLGRLVIGGQLAEPFHASASLGHVCEGVRHCIGLWSWLLDRVVVQNYLETSASQARSTC